MKNLNYDNSVPQFYVQDKFNLVEYFKQYNTEIKKKAEKYNISTACILENIITDLPKNAEAAAELINNVDLEKYEAVRRFAIAANGGRDITTNLPVTE